MQLIMSVQINAAKTPYSRDEDKALVEFVRQHNGWHRVRGKQFWDITLRNNRQLKRSPHSARERFLKRIINFDAHPTNRKLFTKDEIKILENTDSDDDVIPSTTLKKSGDPKLRLSNQVPLSGQKLWQDVGNKHFVTQKKSEHYVSSNLTTDLAVETYKKLMAIEVFHDEEGFEQQIITSLETVIYSFEMLLRENGFADDFNQDERDDWAKRFEFLVCHKYTGNVLIDRLPSTLITLTMLAKTVCLDRSDDN